MSTLFTFWWKATVDTIAFYMRSVKSPDDLVVGGITASLMPSELHGATGARVLPGLLDAPGVLDAGDRLVIDHLVPDYSILGSVGYDYRPSDAYFAYATRGCPNRCPFCAVPTLEPEFEDYTGLRRQLQAIERQFGPKQNLVLLDNNALASDALPRIIDDALESGFARGAMMNGRKRTVDFNQGLDARLLSADKMQLLAELALDPLRLALDSYSESRPYVRAVEISTGHYGGEIATYVLYNYRDTPDDFYHRLRLNVELNARLGTKIYGFPMRYIPLDARDRTYVGPHWNRRLIRGVQCILLATHGLVSPKPDFFQAAFGDSPEELSRICMMPDDYIIHRERHRTNGAEEWATVYARLTDTQRRELAAVLSSHRPSELRHFRTRSGRLRQLVAHHVEALASRKDGAEHGG